MNALNGHLPMLGAVPPSKELKAQPEMLSNALQLMESWLQQARVAAGLNEGQVCAYIGNRKGGAYDQSQWTKARETGDLPFGRMLAGLPPAYLQSFAAALAEHAGLRVVAPDQRVVALKQTAALIQSLADTIERMSA